MSRGKSCVLGDEIENRLCQKLIELGAVGFGRTKLEVLDIVEQFLKASEITVPEFIDNRPGKTWWYRFLARHPEIRPKTPSPLETARIMSCTEESIRSWFAEFQKTLIREGITTASQVN